MIWTGGLPQLSGLPHLPRVPQLHVNRITGPYRHVLLAQLEFKPRPDQHSGFLNNCVESAAFVMTSANLDFQVLLDKDDKP